MGDAAAWAGVAVALLGVVATAFVTLLVSAGRRNRLQMAIEVRDKIPEHQQLMWETMIAQDADVIMRNATRPPWATPALYGGLLVGAVGSFAPGISTGVAVAIQSFGLAFVLIGAGGSLTHVRRNRAKRTQLDKLMDERIRKLQATGELPASPPPSPKSNSGAS